MVTAHLKRFAANLRARARPQRGRCSLRASHRPPGADMEARGWAIWVQWGLWVFLMTLIMGWLGRTRDRARPAAEAGHLAHPRSVLIIGVVCTVLFVGL